MGDPIDYARLAASPCGGTTDAGRPRFLVKHLSLTTVDDVLALCAEVVPDEEVPARARLVLEDAFGDP